MNTKNMLAVTFSCFLVSSAWAAVEHVEGQLLLADNTEVNDPAVHRAPTQERYDANQPRRDESILDHENREDAKDPGTGTNAVDAQSEGSGTTSESIPDNIPPARAR